MQSSEAVVRASLLLVAVLLYGIDLCRADDAQSAESADATIDDRDGSRATSSLETVPEVSTHSKPPPVLDLRITAEDMGRFLDKYADQVLKSTDVEEVMVYETRERLPYWNRSHDVWRGPASLVWGLLHPESAWRVVAPIPMEK